MKKFIKKITHTAKSAVTCVKTAAVNSMSAVLAFNRRAVCSNAGEGYIDTAVKVLIAVVLGALVLAGLYAILNDTVMPTVTQKITEMFSYDNADAWRTLLMENAPTLAKSMKISLENFHWYAAFHDEGHHPHIHMMVWSDDPKEGFLTKDGIAAMRSKLTNAIFRDEMQQIYGRKDVAYSDLVEAAQNAMREMISRMQHQICDSPIIADNMRQLVQALETTTGKKQ